MYKSQIIANDIFAEKYTYEGKLIDITWMRDYYLFVFFHIKKRFLKLDVLKRYFLFSDWEKEETQRLALEKEMKREEEEMKRKEKEMKRMEKEKKNRRTEEKPEGYIKNTKKYSRSLNSSCDKTKNEIKINN